MNRELAEAWRKVAVEAMDAARTLGTRHTRAAVNRAYYALFAFAHSVLIRRREKPRMKEGTWTHEKLPTMFRRRRPHGEAIDRNLARLLRRARIHRESADYDPGATFESHDVTRLITDIGRTVSKVPE